MTQISHYTFKDRQFVFFKLTPELGGVGRVVGVSTTPMAVIGAMYMIKVIHSTQPIPNDDYPYSVISIPESQLEAFDFESKFIQYWLEFSERKV